MEISKNSMKIFLTGFMGSGKTFIGSMLAKKCSMRFIDMDEMIEKRTGKTIVEIFHLQGESAFREVEKEVLQVIINDAENCVVSSGGGTACFYDNMELMNKSGITVYIKLSPDMLFKRLQNDLQNRPLLAGQADLKTFITEKLAEREKFYKRSKYIIKVNNKDTENEILNSLLKLIKKSPDGT